MDPLPGCHAATLGNVKLPGGHTGPVTVFGTDRICHRTADGLAVDIAPQVADQLAEALEGEATFTSVSAGEGCPPRTAARRCAAPSAPATCWRS